MYRHNQKIFRYSLVFSTCLILLHKLFSISTNQVPVSEYNCCWKCPNAIFSGQLIHRVGINFHKGYRVWVISGQLVKLGSQVTTLATPIGIKIRGKNSALEEVVKFSCRLWKNMKKL